MRKSTTIGTTLVGCLLATYFLVTPNTSEIDEEEEHHHDEFLTFSQELLEANHIEIEKALSGKLKQRVRAPAQITVVSDKKAHILPKAAGVAIAAYKNLGENVTAGEIIAILESKEMAEAKSRYLTALKKEGLASKDFIREKNLREKNISSIQDFNNAENTKEEAQIDLELAKQKLHTLGLSREAIEALPSQSPEQLRIYELRSPIAGKVISRHIAPGELVTSDHEVYIIADLSTVWAEIQVFSQDRPFVQQGQPVTISTNDGQSIKTKVSYLSPIINQDTRTSTALVNIDNTSEIWLPGSFAQAEFITEEVSVPLIVKKEAIQNIDGVDVLFIAVENGFAVKPVTKGRGDEEHCEVLSGLEPGEDYACKNTFLLKADLKKDEAEHMD